MWLKRERTGVCEMTVKRIRLILLDLHSRLRRSCNPVTQSRAFHCNFAHTRAFSLYKFLTYLFGISHSKIGIHTREIRIRILLFIHTENIYEYSNDGKITSWVMDLRLYTCWRLLGLWFIFLSDIKQYNFIIHYKTWIMIIQPTLPSKCGAHVCMRAI